MRQARAGHDTRGQRVTPRCRWARARPGFEATRREKLAARTDRGRVATHRHTQRPDTTGMEDAGGTGGYGQASRQRTETHTSMPVAADVEGAGGPGCGARGRGQGLAGQRADAPSEARGADGSRAGRHPPAHTATRHHRCGGRRRVRRARAGFEIDHSEPSGSRVAISRAAGPDGARNTRGATSNTAQGRGPAGPRP